MRSARFRLRGTGDRRRTVAAICSIAAVAALIGIVLVVELPGSSSGASTAAKASGATTVQRRDLVETDTESGTLGYANPQTVFNRLSGTITSLPAVGRVIRPGQTLYRVDGAPVVLFNGTVPAYRDLSDGVSDGADVLELNRNLRSLGFDPEHLITLDDIWQTATTDAVERWQAAVGDSQTGTIALGQVVFLPGTQRVTAVNTALGSTGGASSSAGAASATDVAPQAPRPEFVSLTTTSSTASTPAVTAPQSTTTATTTTTSTTCTAPPTTTTTTSTTPTTTCTTPTTTSTTPATTTPGSSRHGKPSESAILLALLRAETQELKRTLASSGASSRSSSGAGTSSGGGLSGSGRASSSSGGGGGGRSASAGASSAGAGASASGASGASSAGSSGGSGASAQAILQTTSNQLIVTVDLDATKQSEAVVGEPVSIELPDSSTVGGRITQVSPVAQSSSSTSGASASSGGSGGSGSGSSAPSSTIPVSIKVTGHHHLAGMDQAAVSVNFEQQVEKNVLSVPVTALLATAGGGYAVQEALAPHRLFAVTPGLFAAGYVQISGADIYSGLQVTDSQG